MSDEETNFSQKEGSNLGRKVAAIEQKFDELSGSLTQIMSSIESLKQAPSDDDDEYVTRAQVKSEAERLYDQRKKEEKKAYTTYQKNYLRQINREASGVNSEDHQAILDVMKSKFNKKLSENAEYDAQLNYHKARAELLETKIKKSPLKLDKTNSAVDKPGGTDEPKNDTIAVEIDDSAKKFLAYLENSGEGMSTEKINTILQ